MNLDRVDLVLLCSLVACGPGPRPDADLAPPDAAPAPPDGAVTVDTPVDPPKCNELAVTFRDFRADHPDMQDGFGTDFGIVQAALGVDNKPMKASPGPTITVAGQTSFDQWYRDVPGVNQSFAGTLTLVENPPGTFTFDDQDFFPLDGLGFGNEGNPRNFHFTTEIHTTFTYHGGEVFTFSGDDDVFVYVNKRLAIDLGGVHDPLTQSIDFDAQQTQLGITLGETYQLDVFHAERHTVASTFKMVTTIDCFVIF